MNVKINVKDLPKRGLLIISPANPLFNVEAAVQSKGNEDKLKRFSGDSKPFSIFLKNNTDRTVVGYRVIWKLMQADGRTLTHVETMNEPGYLMGAKSLLKSLPDTGAEAIRPNTTRFLSWAPSDAGNYDSEVSAAGTLDIRGEEQIQHESKGGAAEKLAALQAHLARASGLSISIDGAFFDDGTFVGPDTSGYFAELEAQIRAKRDLLTKLARAKDSGEPLRGVFGGIESLANASHVFDPSAPPSQHYAFFSKTFAEELLRMKASLGEDKAVEVALRPLNEPWPELRRAP